ncbi:MAG: translocation/assembly module TamB domain-containing protein [Geoalkalibacter sp.]|uniref:translocation/assembly module TamB domain-containing protein n=1 Tax=Geoalkalibacter sp. TaxID=3041440 RepID=UPI003D10C063
MVSPRVKHILRSATWLLLPLLLLIGTLFWLAATSSGSRAVLTAVSNWTPVQIEFQSMDGSLWRGLTFEGVQVRWPDGEVRLGRLATRWTPLSLVWGRLDIERIEAGSVEVSWKEGNFTPSPAPRESFQLEWPRLKGFPLKLSGRIGSLKLDDVRIAPPGGQPTAEERLHAAVQWDHGILRVESLDLRADAGAAAGDLAVGLDAPLLQLALDLKSSALEGQIASVRVEMNLASAGGDSLPMGPLRVWADRVDQPDLELEGLLVPASGRITAENWRLRRTGASGEVNLNGFYSWQEQFPRVDLQIVLDELDLEPEAGWPTVLNGSLSVSGGLNAYQGVFDLHNARPAWENLALAGDLRGDLEHLELTALNGRWLEGTFDEGHVSLSWAQGFELALQLTARGLNPEPFDGAPPGDLNFVVTGEGTFEPQQPPKGWARIELAPSHLQGHALNGLVAARVQDQDLIVEALSLHGEGFAVEAQGRLQEKIALRFFIDDAGKILPDLAGQAEGEGWFAWAEGEPRGALVAAGEDLAYEELSIDRWSLDVEWPGMQRPLRGEAKVEGLMTRVLALKEIRTGLTGLPDDHELSLAAHWGTGQAQALIQGSLRGQQWQGVIERLEGEEAEVGHWQSLKPVAFKLSTQQARIADLVLESSVGGELSAGAELSFSPLRGEIEGAWRNLSLAHFNPWIAAVQLEGESSGDLQWLLGGAEQMDLYAELQATAKVQHGSEDLVLDEVLVDLVWDRQGLKLHGQVDFGIGGRVRLAADSPQPGRPDLPDPLNFQVSWDKFLLKRLEGFVPAGVQLEGEWLGRLEGRLGPGGILAVEGTSRVSDGFLRRRDEDGEWSVALRQAELLWQWREETLQGELDLTLGDFGEATASFQLPLPARLVTAFEDDGAVSVLAQAHMREQGLLEMLLPGLAEDIAGELAFVAEVGGTWQNPRWQGDFSLTQAGATLPAAGLVLDEIEVAGRIVERRIEVERLQLRSGPGKLTGRVQVDLEDFSAPVYTGEIKGSKVQVMNLPELQIQISPDLTFRGRPDAFAVKGKVHVPVFLVYDWQNEGMVKPSSDVEIVGRESEPEAARPFNLDLDVDVTLGERVILQAKGLDARLEGGLKVMTNERSDLIGQGEISVAKGHYAAFGLKLPITRGRLLFAGGPLDRPGLDILALREIGEVRAGVQMTGTARAPRVKLYSEPGMPDTDILSYIVLGRPLGESGGQADVLMLAAGALLSRGESAALQDKLKRRLGIDVIEVESGAGDVEASMVTVGKYLTPDLYVSFGQALFGEASVARLRYSLSEKWDFESQFGTVSGADLYYKVHFD